MAIKTSLITVHLGMAASDIVGVFPDSHVFSDHEHDIFTIVQNVGPAKDL